MSEWRFAARPDRQGTVAVQGQPRYALLASCWEKVLVMAVPARPRPLARAAAGSGGCLVIAAAAMKIALRLDPGATPAPHDSWAKYFVLIAVAAALAAVGIAVYGVGTWVEHRRSGRQLPSRPRPGGSALDSERPGRAGHRPVPPGPRTGKNGADMRARRSQQCRRYGSARAGKAPGGARGMPGFVRGLVDTLAGTCVGCGHQSKVTQSSSHHGSRGLERGPVRGPGPRKIPVLRVQSVC